MKKGTDDQLGKVASECADKLRGMDAVVPPVPPPIPTPEKQTIAYFTANVVIPDNQYDRMLDVAAVIALASGFTAIGFAIASGVR